MSKILRNASLEKISDAITLNQLYSWQDFVVAPYDAYDLFGIKGVITGVPYMMMNPLYDADPRITHQDVLDVIKWFEAKHLPMMWFITPQNPASSLSSILDDVGLERATMEVPGMYLDLSSMGENRLESPKELHLSQARNNDIVNIVEVMMEAFEVSSHPAIATGMQNFFKSMIKYSASTTVIARSGTEIVGCASIVYAAGVAGIYNVSVLPNYRRQGIATVMMDFLIHGAKSKNYQYVILHSSARGKRVYENLGFQTAFVYDRYLLRPDKVGFE